MNVTTLDVETSYHRKYDDTVSSPFEGDILVSVGYKVNDKPCEYLCFNHNHQKPTKDAKQILQKVFEELQYNNQISYEEVLTLTKKLSGGIELL